MCYFCFFLCQIFNCQCTVCTIFLGVLYIFRQTVLLAVAGWFSNFVLVSSTFHLILLILGTLLCIRSFRLEMLLFLVLLFLMLNLLILLHLMYKYTFLFLGVSICVFIIAYEKSCFFMCNVVE